MHRQSWEREIAACLRVVLSTGRQWVLRDGEGGDEDDESITPGDRATARVVHLLNRAVVGHALACRAAGYGPVETLLAVRALCRPRILPVLATDQAFIGRALLGRIVTWTMRVLFPEGTPYAIAPTRPVDRIVI